MHLRTGLRLSGIVAVMALCAGVRDAGAQKDIGASVDHRVLATSKTSTMEKELNEAAEAGFRFQAVMGGESSFGGKEVVVVMSRAEQKTGRFAYKLLATSKTSTLEKELREAAEASFEVVGMTVGETLMGGSELVTITRKKK